MNKVTTINQIPERSLILKDFGMVHYHDTYRIDIKGDDTIDDITRRVFESPNWSDKLMTLRNFIVSAFGLKTANRQDTKAEPFYSVGSRAGYFTVSDRNDQEIVLAENDRHLNFRTSLMVDRSEADTALYLSTIVHFNNFFGRLYFFPVKPFHRLIVKSLLKRCKT